MSSIPLCCSPWDHFLVGGYLSSRVLLELLQKVLAGPVNLAGHWWPAGVSDLAQCYFGVAAAGSAT